MAIAHRAGLEVVALETETHALLRAAVPREEKRPIMVIDMGETRTGFLIAEEGVAASTATKPIGGAKMIDAIKRATGFSLDESARLFYEKGLLPAPTAAATDGPNHANEIFGALMPLIGTLRDEIAKHIAFWQTSRPPPVHIYLTGGIAHLEGLPEYFAYELHIPVSRANPASNLFVLDEYIPPINRHDTLLWATALGLAARNIE
jgi:Tfp pilus assembly PilM family ATPase